MLAQGLITLQSRVSAKFYCVINRFKLNFQLQNNKLAFFKSSAALIVGYLPARGVFLLAPFDDRMLLLELALTKSALCRCCTRYFSHTSLIPRSRA
ncbi:hypothetical protein KCP70_11110 [Salmonella enterica subsp. enterica]|nr:hypothetical protein KCP70_11110 [Salmonella enterica subsp. enterica]